MPHRDTSVAIQQAINPGSKCHTVTQAQLSNKLLIQALNAKQGHNRSYPTSYQFNQNTTHPALNATQPSGTQAQLSNKLLVQPEHNPPGCTQGHKRSYPTSYQFSALNYKQGHKRSYPTSHQFSALNSTQGHKPSYITIQIRRNDPT